MIVGFKNIKWQKQLQLKGDSKFYFRYMPLRHAKKISRKQGYIYIGGKVFFHKLIGERYSGVIIIEGIVKITK